MPVTSMNTDPAALTLTIVADFPVPVQRLWEAFADPRQLERFWGPPGYPATFGDFDFREGGGALYWMTTPEGEKLYARWDFTEIAAPTVLRYQDRFADEKGEIDESMPASDSVMTFESTATGSRFTSVTSFDSADALQAALEMGWDEGMNLALNQLDTVLADLREYALGKGTQTEILDDTHVRITRAFEAPRSLIWRAHTEPELMKRWLLGPDGWEMTVCELDTTPGGKYQYAWAPVGDTEGEAFGFEGVTQVFDPERRMVSTESMTGAPFPANLNDLSFDEVDGVTLLTLLITYPSLEQRDMILSTGMTDGMEASYARLEKELVDA